MAAVGMIVPVAVIVYFAVGVPLFVWLWWRPDVRVIDAVVVAIAWPMLWPIGLVIVAVDAIRTRLR